MTRILIADDDNDDVELFRMALNGVAENAELHIVSDGEALLKNLHDTNVPNPDFLFLDLSMPILSGFDCLNQVRKNGDYDKVKIIILSDSVNVGEIDDAYDLGANYFITKPSDLNEFQNLLDFLFSNASDTPPPRAEFVLRHQATGVGK